MWLITNCISAIWSSRLNSVTISLKKFWRTWIVICGNAVFLFLYGECIEEYKDSIRNFVNKKTYKDLQHQGLLSMTRKTKINHGTHGSPPSVDDRQFSRMLIYFWNGEAKIRCIWCRALRPIPTPSLEYRSHKNCAMKGIVFIHYSTTHPKRDDNF